MNNRLRESSNGVLVESGTWYQDWPVIIPAGLGLGER